MQNGTLQDLIDQAQCSNHPLPEHRILRLLVSACDGLEAMHCRNLAHRDIKVQTIQKSCEGVRYELAPFICTLS